MGVPSLTASFRAHVNIVSLL